MATDFVEVYLEVIFLIFDKEFESGFDLQVSAIRTYMQIFRKITMSIDRFLSFSFNHFFMES